MGFSINYILFNIVCVGLIFHSEFVNKTFLYEKNAWYIHDAKPRTTIFDCDRNCACREHFFVVLFMVFSIKMDNQAWR